MTAERHRQVVLFGLSANPPTGMGGHAGLALWASTRDWVDEVWIVPVFRHAFFEKRSMPSFEHRLQMCRLAFSSLPGARAPIRVLDVERALAAGLSPGDVLGTVDVVRALCAAHPEVRFTLLLGADTYRDLAEERWKESAALKAMVPLLVMPRIGSSVSVEAPADPPALSAVSSTQVRAMADEASLEAELMPEVLEYIRAHHLYAFAPD